MIKKLMSNIDGEWKKSSQALPKPSFWCDESDSDKVKVGNVGEYQKLKKGKWEVEEEMAEPFSCMLYNNHFCGIMMKLN